MLPQFFCCQLVLVAGLWQKAVVASANGSRVALCQHQQCDGVLMRVTVFT